MAPKETSWANHQSQAWIWVSLNIRNKDQFLHRIAIFCCYSNLQYKASHSVSTQRSSLAQMLVTLTVVNWNNILRAAFASISFCRKITSTICKHIKAGQNTFVQKNCLWNADEIDTRLFEERKKIDNSLCLKFFCACPWKRTIFFAFFFLSVTHYTIYKH